MKIIDVEQGSSEWLTARLGIPTASQFHRIITPKTLKPSAQQHGYIAQLLAEWALGLRLENGSSAFMERGTAMEDEARSWYSLYHATPSTPIEQVGFCLSDCLRYGGSPDGLVGDDGIIEIKCKSATEHVSALLWPLSDEHNCQIQGLLLITGRQWCDRVYYSPSLPSLVVRVERDEKFLAALSAALVNFCDELDACRERAKSLGMTQWVPPTVEAGELTEPMYTGPIDYDAVLAPTPQEEGARREPTIEEWTAIYGT